MVDRKQIEKKEAWDKVFPSGHASNDLLPPTRPHLLLSAAFQRCYQIVNLEWINPLMRLEPS
jgi:hypothetical protein